MLGKELTIETPELYKIKYIMGRQMNTSYNKLYPNNRISTTKYTLEYFFPKSLLLQIKKTANIIFLL